MKKFFFAIAFLSFLLLGARDLRAQVYPYYDPYWDFQYQQYLQYQRYMQWQDYLEYLRQTDPYYDLHLMHYQLYLQPYQSYPIYQPCCYAFGVPVRATALGRAATQVVKGRAPQAVRRR